MPYTVQLQQFEGPLDLLLHLIEEAALDVKDIFVSEITAQYLSYMDQLDELDMDTASEFLITKRHFHRVIAKTPKLEKERLFSDYLATALQSSLPNPAALAF